MYRCTRPDSDSSDSNTITDGDHKDSGISNSNSNCNSVSYCHITTCFEVVMLFTARIDKFNKCNVVHRHGTCNRQYARWSSGHSDVAFTRSDCCCSVPALVLACHTRPESSKSYISMTCVHLPNRQIPR